MANKKIADMDTMDVKAQKKKRLIVISAFAIVLVLAAFGIGSAMLNTDKKKIFNQRQQLAETQNLDIIQNPEFKETWAISIENRMKEQEKKTETLIAEYSNKQLRFLDEVKQTLQQDRAETQNNIKAMGESFTNKMTSLKQDIASQLKQQEEKIKQIEIMAGKNVGAGIRGEDDVVIGMDFSGNKGKGSKVVSGPNGVMILIPPPKVVDINITAEDGNITTKSITKQPEFAIAIDKNGTRTQVPLDKKGNPVLVDRNITVDANASIVDSNATKMKVEDLIKLPPKKTRKEVKTVKIDNRFNSAIIAAQKEIENEDDAATEKEQKDKSSFHLNTGLSQAYMITGAYAPAFQEGDSEPLPVLFEAEGSIIQPNDFLGSIDKCFLLGSAKGNMNSQTAEIKLVSVSCLVNDGDYRIEAPITGWVIGENGIPGVGGELLHKNGAWLARTFIAGFLETFANALTSGDTTTINLGGGNSSSSRSNDEGLGKSFSNNALYAGASGLSTVFSKLGDYYLKMAEQIFPVIEVRGGRTVDLLLMGGEDFSVVENNRIDLSSVEAFLVNKKLKDESDKGKIKQKNAFTRSLMKDIPSENDEDMSSSSNDGVQYEPVSDGNTIKER